jgi:hypothetical protein
MPDPATCRHALPFLDRAPGQCAWPLWGEDTPRAERQVCGAPTPSRSCSWCTRHARRAFVPANERMQP